MVHRFRDMLLRTCLACHEADSVPLEGLVCRLIICSGAIYLLIQVQEGDS